MATAMRVEREVGWADGAMFSLGGKGGGVRFSGEQQS
jgi:hypothetical protein